MTGPSLSGDAVLVQSSLDGQSLFIAAHGGNLRLSDRFGKSDYAIDAGSRKSFRARTASRRRCLSVLREPGRSRMAVAVQWLESQRGVCAIDRWARFERFTKGPALKRETYNDASQNQELTNPHSPLSVHGRVHGCVLRRRVRRANWFPHPDVRRVTRQRRGFELLRRRIWQPPGAAPGRTTESPSEWLRTRWFPNPPGAPAASVRTQAGAPWCSS